MKLSSEVDEARLVACAACPWRASNQGKRHPGGWYTKANLRRLWSKLRTGDGMTCHPTDPTNPVPDGLPRPSDDATTHECAGALILQQREVMRLQDYDNYRDYKRAHPLGLTREGAGVIISRFVFGRKELGVFAARTMPKPNLNDLDVQYEIVGEWETRG